MECTSGDACRRAHSARILEARALARAGAERVGSAADSSLARPRLVTGSADQIAIYDSVHASVQAFDRSGRRRWTTGRRGQGPGEFRNVVDIRIAPDSTVWVVDGGAGQLVRLAMSDGAPVGRPIRIAPMTLRLLPLRAGIVALTVSPNEFGQIVDSAGTVLRSLPLPDSALVDVHPALRQPFAAADASGERWAAIFPHGNRFVVYRGLDVQCVGTLPGAPPFPAQLPSGAPPRAVAIGLALFTDELVILRQSPDSGGPAELEWYDAERCARTARERLDGRYVGLSSMGDALVLVREELFPEIIAIVRRAPRP